MNDSDDGDDDNDTVFSGEIDDDDDEYNDTLLPDEIEEELAPLIEAQEVKVQETYDDQVNKARTASSDLSWIHVLGR